jgi:hypothetical protein
MAPERPQLGLTVLPERRSIAPQETKRESQLRVPTPKQGPSIGYGLVETAAGRALAGGGFDPGYPLPGRIRQARLPVPAGVEWQGLRLRGELD